MIMNTSLIETWELPSPFFLQITPLIVRITLAIFENYPRHPQVVKM